MLICEIHKSTGEESNYRPRTVWQLRDYAGINGNFVGCSSADLLAAIHACVGRFVVSSLIICQPFII